METKPLPKCAPIAVSEIPEASALLFYGGNKLTEFVGNNLYKHPYRPPAFHAAFYIRDGLFLNVGKFKVIQKLEDEFRSSRRIDVISYSALLNADRVALCTFAILDTSKPKVGFDLPDYGIIDYLRFGFKFLRPTKNDICSENVVELFAMRKIVVSYRRPADTAPWHLFEFAYQNPEVCVVRTLHVGADFKT